MEKGPEESLVKWVNFQIVDLKTLCKRLYYSLLCFCIYKVQDRICQMNMPVWSKRLR